MRAYLSEDAGFQGNFYVLTGNTGEVLEDVEMIFDRDSLEKITEFLVANRITSENQDLFIKNMCVKSDDAEIITRGQHNYIRNGNTISFRNNIRNPIHFKAELKTFSILANKEFSTNITIGNFQIDFSDDGEDANGLTFFENVKMLVTSDNNRYEIISDTDNITL